VESKLGRTYDDFPNKWYQFSCFALYKDPSKKEKSMAIRLDFAHVWPVRSQQVKRRNTVGNKKTFIVTMCFVLGVVGWTETVRGIDSDWYNNWRSLRFLFFFRRKGKEKEKVAGRRIAHHSVFQWRHPQLATCQTGRSPRINVIRRRGCFSGGGGKSGSNSDSSF